LLTLVIVAVALIAFAVFTQFWTDKLWFESIGFVTVFSTELWTRLALFFGVGGLMALLVGGNMWLAIRLAPRGRRAGDSAVLDAYRRMLENNKVVAVLVPSIALGVLAGMSGTTEVLRCWPGSTPSHSVNSTRTSASTTSSTSSSCRSGRASCPFC